jgi:pimeloyl-ACP methyl ester carboxylesterase
MIRMRCTAAGLILAGFFGAPVVLAAGPAEAPEPPLGIGIEAWPYPAPVRFFDLVLDGQPCRMAYMDVAPTGPASGRTAVLLHGKNFSSDYWAGVIAHLAARGDRVLVPDQVGFNKSAKPDLDYTFDMLSANTLALLDHLGLGAPVDLVGHSTGGMLAVHIARLHPERIRRLVLEDPIGLEDYGRVIPPQTTETLAAAERRQTAESYRAFIARYFVTYPKAEQERFVDQRMRIAGSGEFERWVKASAETYQMIYRHPVRDEYRALAMPVLIVVGGEDRTVVMKGYGDPARTAAMGNFPVLAREACAEVRDCRVSVIPGSGHVPHLEKPEAFAAALDAFLP